MVLKSQKEPARVFLNDRDSWVYREQTIGDEERRKLATLQSELLLPLAVRDKLLGFISLGPKRSEEPYTGSDVRLLKSVAAQTGLALENANLLQTVADEVAKRERLNREVEIAREVQERLFPQKLPVISGLDYAGHCRPALGVGGDYYDFLALPQGNLGIAIGDVSGKGIAAALLMANLQANLRSQCSIGHDCLENILRVVNQFFSQNTPDGSFATLFFADYHVPTGRLRYINCGHPPALILRCDDSIDRLDPTATVLGIFKKWDCELGERTIHPGDTLVLYTDGITESFNESRDEYGEARLIESLLRHRAQPSQSLLQNIVADVRQFSPHEQHDDITLIIAKSSPAPV